MNVSTYEDELVRYTEKKYGTLDVLKRYDKVVQGDVEEHMENYCLRFVNASHNLKRKNDALNEHRKMFNAFIEKLRK